jgi:hypothetical protein
MSAGKVCWNLVLDEMLRAWDEEGLALDLQFERLSLLVPEGATLRALTRRREKLGLVKHNPWVGRPTEILEERYNYFTVGNVQRTIEAETGFRPSEQAIHNKAHKMGLSGFSARGLVCLEEAASSVGLTAVGLRHALKQMGVPLRGRSKRRYLDERAMRTVEAIYPVLGDDWETDAEAADDLGVDFRQVRRLCRQRALHGRAWGYRDWRIPKRAIAQFRAPSGWTSPDPFAVHHAHLIGRYVTAGRPLYVVRRVDGSLLVPSPCTERVTYRRGQVVGKVTGFIAGQAIVDTRFAELPCDIGLLQRIPDAEPIARL